MSALGRHARRIIAFSGVVAIYTVVRWVSRRLARTRVARPSGCIVVIGTFHNPNWFHAHIRPLARSGVGTVVLICDEPVDPVRGVTVRCAPRWLQLVLTRAGAKLVWAVLCGWRYRPDLYMGYHIFPCAVIALLVARLFGKPACYQVTSGIIELEGGGWRADNAALRALDRPSPRVERSAAAVVREFDSVVVRGSGAASYIRELGYERSLAVITGSVEPRAAWRDFHSRTIDIAFVGRLTDVKRPDRFINVVAAVAAALPAVRVAVIGDGPDAPALHRQADALGLNDTVFFLGQRADVDDLLAATRVFVLTSRSEGLSIAMLEAMAAGAVPVVADVGDLRDAIHDNEDGFLIEQDDIAGYATAAIRLLRDEREWCACSHQARHAALMRSGTDAIAQQWQRHLRGVLNERIASQAASASGPTP
jgi:glycosyltransferase involved in cell wall biosynthesis